MRRNETVHFLTYFYMIYWLSIIKTSCAMRKNRPRTGDTYLFRPPLLPLTPRQRILASVPAGQGRPGFNPGRRSAVTGLQAGQPSRAGDALRETRHGVWGETVCEHFPSKISGSFMFRADGPCRTSRISISALKRHRQLSRARRSRRASGRKAGPSVSFTVPLAAPTGCKPILTTPQLQTSSAGHAAKTMN